MMPDFLDQFVNKRVTFRFCRQELAFDLSQSLFSSFDVDVGTRLLLKTLAKAVDLAGVESVLDVGCGVGVIGLSLKKVNPKLALAAQDRDALALAFTRRNAALNRIGAVAFPGGLGLQGLGARRFDLIVSNLPGKAGAPVLADMLGRMAAHLNPSGRAAVVIVNPLAERVEQELTGRGCEVLLKEAGKGHTAFHFRGGKGAETAVTLAAYFRGRHPFKTAGTAYELETVYNVPEFDTLSFSTALGMELLKNRRGHGRLLVWNPGQGHAAVWAVKRWGTAVAHVTLAGRDGLSLLAARHNLLAQGMEEKGVTAVHAPTLHDVTGQFDAILYFPDTDPGVPWHKHLPGLWAERLTPGGWALVVGKSAFNGRLAPELGAFATLADKKRRGFRALLLTLAKKI